MRLGPWTGLTGAGSASQDLETLRIRLSHRMAPWYETDTGTRFTGLRSVIWSFLTLKSPLQLWSWRKNISLCVSFPSRAGLLSCALYSRPPHLQNSLLVPSDFEGGDPFSFLQGYLNSQECANEKTNFKNPPVNHLTANMTHRAR